MTSGRQPNVVVTRFGTSNETIRTALTSESALYPPRSSHGGS